MFEDSRVETNIIGENAIQLFISGDNIKTIGGDKGDGIISTSDFLKDMDFGGRGGQVAAHLHRPIKKGSKLLLKVKMNTARVAYADRFNLKLNRRKTQHPPSQEKSRACLL